MSSNKKSIIVLTSIVILAIIIVLGDITKTNNSYKSDNVVNVYSARNYESDKIIYEAFEKKTGIRVNLITGKNSELLEQLIREGEDTEADLFLTSDVVNFNQAIDSNLIKPIESEEVNKNVMENLRGKNNEWIGLTIRVRAIAYNKETVSKDELSTFKELASDKWEGEVMTRSSDSLYTIKLLGSIIESYGEEEAKDWASKIVDNFARIPEGNDKDQIKAISDGEGSIAIVSAHYVGCMLNSQYQEELEAANQVGVLIPNDTSISVSGIALSRFSKNEENAIKLIEFMTDEKAQQAFTDNSYEFPVNNNVSANKTLLSWGEIDPKDIDLDNLCVNNKKAIEILNEVGWK